MPKTILFVAAPLTLLAQRTLAKFFFAMAPLPFWYFALRNAPGPIAPSNNPFLMHVVPPLYSLRESSVTNGTIESETIQRRSAKDDTHKSRSEHRLPPTVTAQVKGIKVNDVENQPCYRGWRFIFIVSIHKNSQIGAPATVGEVFWISLTLPQ